MMHTHTRTPPNGIFFIFFSRCSVASTASVQKSDWRVERAAFCILDRVHRVVPVPVPVPVPIRALVNRNPGNEKPAFHRAYMYVPLLFPGTVRYILSPSLCILLHQERARGCIRGHYAIVQGQDVITHVCYVYISLTAWYPRALAASAFFSLFRDQLIEEPVSTPRQTHPRLT